MISMRPINETDSWLNIDVDTFASGRTSSVNMT